MSEERLKKLLVGMAEIYGVQLTVSRLTGYAELLADLPYADVERAMKALMQDPSVRFLPLPAQIREKALGGLPVAAAAQELLTRAIEAVGLYGLSKADAARAYLGELVWGALPSYSGWIEWCWAGDPTGVDLTTARAQLRERILSRLRSENPSGVVALPPPGKPTEEDNRKYFEHDREGQRLEALRDQAAGIIATPLPVEDHGELQPIGQSIASPLSRRDRAAGEREDEP